MASYLEHLCIEFSDPGCTIKQLEPDVISDIVKGTFKDSQGNLHLQGKGVLHGSQALIGAPLVGGNHWCFVHINVVNRTFLFMDPKGDPGIDCTVGSRFMQHWQMFCSYWNSKGNAPELPQKYILQIRRHAIQPPDDANNCGIYTLTVSQT